MKTKVPKKQWSKWSKRAQAVFNRCYKFFRTSQWAMVHPKAPTLNARLWDTTAYNAAWIAADAVDNIVPTKIVEV